MSSKSRKVDERAQEGSAAPTQEDILLGVGAPLTDRVNVEPPILNGMTATEAKVAGALALGLWLAIGGIAAVVTGIWQCILGCGVIGTLVTVWRVSLWLATVKRGRPDGFYLQRARVWASRRGLARARFINHDNAFELGRPI